MTGSDAIVSITGLYDYIGAVRGQLETLIDTVTVEHPPTPAPPKKRKRFLIF